MTLDFMLLMAANLALAGFCAWRAYEQDKRENPDGRATDPADRTTKTLL